MIRKLMKKIMTVVCVSAVLISAVASPVNTDAASKNAKAKKAYVKYLKKDISGGQNYSWFKYNFYDFNKDGIDEFVVNTLGQNDIYTYRNGKVVNIVEGENGTGYLKGKKYIVCYGRDGASYSIYTVYKMKKSGKAKIVETYEYDNGKYKHNGKKISKSKYYKFEKKIKWNIGKTYKLK